MTGAKDGLGSGEEGAPAGSATAPMPSPPNPPVTAQPNAQHNGQGWPGSATGLPAASGASPAGPGRGGAPATVAAAIDPAGTSGPRPPAKAAPVAMARMPLTSLVPAPYNPRKIDTAALAGLSASVRRFGLVQPVVWNRRTGYVVSGHQRLEVLRRDGVQETDVVVVDLAPLDEKALNLTQNNAAITGEFTPEAETLLDEIRAAGEAEFKLLRLDALEASLDFGTPDEVQPTAGEDDVPDAPKVPTTRLGDLWLLGDHRLVCGDSTDPAVVARACDGHRAVLMATDPPYGVAYSDNVRCRAELVAGHAPRERKWADGCIENDAQGGAGLRDFLERMLKAAVGEALVPNAAWYLWHAQMSQAEVAEAMEAHGALRHRQIVWVKPSLLFGFGDYHWRHEACFYGWVRGHRPPFYGERNQTTVWEIKHEASNADRVHPTQKPVEISRRPLLNHTKTGEWCYEPFCGSGSCLVAAEQLGRRCAAVELSPAYCASSWNAGRT